MNTLVRRLEGISYWVIEDPDGIRDFINTEVRKEWDLDVRSMPGDPAAGDWLPSLPQRKWRLDDVQTSRVKQDERHELRRRQDRLQFRRTLGETQAAIAPCNRKLRNCDLAHNHPERGHGDPGWLLSLHNTQRNEHPEYLRLHGQPLT